MANRTAMSRSPATSPHNAAANGASIAGVTGFELTQQGVINAVPAISSQTRSSGASSLVLTSGTSGAIPFLAQLLPENGVNPAQVQFIGMQRLDVPASALSLSGLQGAWFAVPDPAFAVTIPNARI